MLKAVVEDVFETDITKETYDNILRMNNQYIEEMINLITA